jgi:endonuclease I
MKKIFTLSLLCGLLFSEAQNIEVVSNVLNFPNTTELTPSGATVYVYNPGIYPIVVEDVDLFSLYQRIPFTTLDTAFTLMPQDTQEVAVSFGPHQNVQHNLAMVFKTTSGFGHVSVELKGQGTFSNTYYNSTQNLSDQALKSALKTTLGTGYNSLGYTLARDNMYGTIDNDGGDVTCVYTGRMATFNTRAGANSNNFNTEHTFPQGFFSQAEPMRSDLHHLFPTDVTANSQRGNDPFGVVSGTPSWQNGGSKSGGGTFEPRDAHKGAAARAMMYFVIRYQDYANHFAPQEAVLRSWHNTFPPVGGDIARNNAIAALQTARNPFVDYPQLEQRIYSFVTAASTPLVKALYVSDDTIRLAQLAGRYVYDFVLFNEGTEDVTLNNFNLSDTSMYFDQGAPATLTLAPGDAYTLKINFNASNAYFASLSFNTDLASNPSIVVPIRSGTSIGLAETQTLKRFAVYPNPAHDYLKLSYGKQVPTALWLVDMQGRATPLEVSDHVECTDLSKGIYVLKARYADGYVATERVVIL